MKQFVRIMFLFTFKQYYYLLSTSFNNTNFIQNNKYRKNKINARK